MRTYIIGLIIVLSGLVFSCQSREPEKVSEEPETGLWRAVINLNDSTESAFSFRADQIR